MGRAKTVPNGGVSTDEYRPRGHSGYPRDGRFCDLRYTRVRKEAKKMLRLAHDVAYLKLKNDMVWQFIEPADNTYSLEIAKGLHEFGHLAQALNPALTPDLIKAAVEKEALEFADELVRGGTAKWKKDYDLEKLRKAIDGWKVEKTAERAKKILGEANTPWLKFK
jgi:hypothetical protein